MMVTIMWHTQLVSLADSGGFSRESLIKNGTRLAGVSVLKLILFIATGIVFLVRLSLFRQRTPHQLLLISRNLIDQTNCQESQNDLDEI